jgi:hypothetical protein
MIDSLKVKCVKNWPNANNIRVCIIFYIKFNTALLSYCYLFILTYWLQAFCNFLWEINMYGKNEVMFSFLFTSQSVKVHNFVYSVIKMADKSCLPWVKQKRHILYARTNNIMPACLPLTFQILTGFAVSHNTLDDQYDL